MLKIFNILSIFFEDCYIKVNVREYARLKKITPPTASKILKELEKERLLLQNKERNYLFYRANRENLLFIDLSKAYWRQQLLPLIDFLSKQANFENITLFGSLVKGEATSNSDIDLFINCSSRKINLTDYNKQYKRNIQLHFNESLRNESLRKNIQQGLLLYGG